MSAPSKKSVKVRSSLTQHKKEDQTARTRSVDAASVKKRQVAALPFRKSTTGETEVLLITSRETGRFIIPKGWPMKRLSNAEAAAREAYEEAGVVGKSKHRPVGEYLYWKRLDRKFELIRVEVFALEVAKQRSEWPEKGTRQSRWLSPQAAAKLVEEPGLVSILRDFRG